MSNWVVTVDRTFGVEFLDTPDRIGGPAYLIENAPEGATANGHPIVTSTSRLAKLRRLAQPKLSQLGLPAGDVEAGVILEAVKSISGRLVLQLQDRNASSAMPGFGVSRLFLRQSGVLGEMLIVPWDARRWLFASAMSDGIMSSRSGSDLAMIRPAGFR
ncbi:MAG: hypothetical protein ACKOWF_19760 [Chloroflexota bacterium]